MLHFGAMLTRIIDWLDRINGFAGRLIAPLAAVMAVATVVVVIARYGFGIGAVPLQEAVVYMHAIVFMLAIGYTLREGEHVRVDIVYQRFGPRGRAIIDLIGTVFFLAPVAGFIFWTSLDYVSLSWRMGEGSAEPGGLPGVYVLKTLIPVMAALLLVQGLAEAGKHVRVLISRDA